MTVRNFSDIATYVCRQYKIRIKKSKDKGLFVRIEEEAYELWGKKFGYDDSHAFKSDITKIINKRRKEKELSEEEMEITQELNAPRQKPSLEGRSCFIFTINQIHNYQLNPDSYF